MFSKALLIFSLFSVAFATVYVTAPVASTVYSGNSGAVVTWQDNEITPSLALFGPATISIYAGNALQQTSLQVLSNNTNVSAVSTINFTPNSGIGPNGDFYFIRFESISGKDNTSTPYEAFSAQFTLTGMTGKFSASVLAEISGQSTAPLAAQTSSPTSTPSLTTSTASNNPTSTKSTTSATASSGAMGLKAGWAGIVFGAVVGVTMF